MFDPATSPALVAENDTFALPVAPEATVTVMLELFTKLSPFAETVDPLLAETGN